MAVSPTRVMTRNMTISDVRVFLKPCPCKLPLVPEMRLLSSTLTLLLHLLPPSVTPSLPFNFYGRNILHAIEKKNHSASSLKSSRTGIVISVLFQRNVLVANDIVVVLP